MTTLASILPTSASPDPKLTRPIVPAALTNKPVEQKKSPQVDAQNQEKSREQSPPIREKGYLAEENSTSKTSSSNGPLGANLGGASAVVLQVSEARTSSSSSDLSFKATEPTSSEKSSLTNELTDEEKQIVADLKARDAEVRRHEQAHAASGGGYTGAIEYEYTRGPDDQRYAISGKVSIDTSSVPDNPEATIEKMRIIQSAALAPASPSGADRAVAAEAAAKLRQAEAALKEKRSEEKVEKEEALEQRPSQLERLQSTQESESQAFTNNLGSEAETVPFQQGIDLIA
ncbi:putative metalloprotease CJM1_0395 family protein [Temperatibacter marinus]|uniref:Metalloprotease CJM1_0395 family protein n=1 Tax=Temperatibacter marinus TaxID=1456591 RepID=A0AA52EK25_9PROT|nr:putative metalloprotease CJM1_0395 family protein [Temperatibacter marinus]WND03689.1 putative metalloprotease CJM1_0395 family protein [Temperatibacter marinus]